MSIGKMTKTEIERVLKRHVDKIMEQCLDLMRPDPILVQPDYVNVLVEIIIREEGVSEKLLKDIGETLGKKWLGKRGKVLCRK